MEPLAAVILMLRPRTVAAKIISGAGRWGVRYPRIDNAGFGLVLQGSCHLGVDGCAPLQLEKGDFVLIPSAPGFVFSSDPDFEPVPIDPAMATAARGELRHGDPRAETDFRLLGGYFGFDPANTALLVGLLPTLVHIRADEGAARRLVGTIDMITDEALNQRPGRDLIVERLVEVMLVEALRFRPQVIGAISRVGLLQGLSDPTLARALRAIHADVARDWTVATLAREAGLSRSTFSERFAQKVGMAPMEYLVRWRMALAKDFLRRKDMPLERLAEAIGYQSASAFSTAFRREVGVPPSHFARSLRDRSPDATMALAAGRA
ncbi:AraC family transcriptional regulator [Arenibaculum pallidiluteum]|uniref:AraC family transcriptional regulator n=1 Tax=Arenibaculum pallidiluteum TaxID=2812559 RepID=UPI001A97D00B|nr:AraC family transcriptional regulator [Arenibaculum pallidiluteum]